jgi:zinc protease
VGSKDEHIGEKGIAHLIEHMIFKGTKKMLSESDIKIVVHKLSGDCNAFTSYDYTGYKFNMPSQHWKEMLPIMADCMVNASFKDDHLNSEMKAVIQELKMLKDNHTRQIAYDLLTTIFPDHPYHYPLIGYKQDLWSVSGADLERFYKKHYHPNNATLVVVGDVDQKEVFELTEKYFGHIPANTNYKKESFYHNQDIVSKSVTLYRDIKQPTGVIAFVIPGNKEKMSHLSDVISIILGSGKSSRLYKRLVDQERLVSSISVSPLDLFDHGLLLFIYSPKNVEDIPVIEQIILDTIQSLASSGPEQQELQTALNNAKMAEYNLLENNEMQAYLIGQYYLATGDPNYAFTYLEIPKEKFTKEIPLYLKQYIRPSVMHRGLILPLADDADRYQWLSLQTASDKQDNDILSARKRLTPIELPRYANDVKVSSPQDFSFPKAKNGVLSNGVKLLWYNNPETPKINLTLELKAKSWFDPEEKQGLFSFLSRMMTEGTKLYTADQLAHELESRGMNLAIYPGGVSMMMLRDDFEKGIELLCEVLTHATLPEDKIEKVRSQIYVGLKQLWDNPVAFSGQLANEIVYKGHPFSKNAVGTMDSITGVTRDDLVQYYHQVISPDGATLAVVGDLHGIDVQNILNEKLGIWSGKKVNEPNYPTLSLVKHQELNVPINRDQVVLMFAGLSVNRDHPDFDKLLLFDQIFAGGGLHSRLMQLREQTGIFYSISGSTTLQAGKQPGMTMVRTMVSKDRLYEAEQAIKELIDSVVDTLTEQELMEAKNVITNSLIGIFNSNANIAQAFLFLEKYGFASDYFDHRAKILDQITLQEVKDAAHKYMNSDMMAVLRIGRVD